MSKPWWVLWCAWALIACGGGYVDPKGAELPEPWRTMNLPVGAGTVETSGPTELHVSYIDLGADRAETAKLWAATLERRGWVETDLRRMGPLIGVTYSRDGQELELIVGAQGKRVDVQLDLD